MCSRHTFLDIDDSKKGLCKYVVKCGKTNVFHYVKKRGAGVVRLEYHFLLSILIKFLLFNNTFIFLTWQIQNIIEESIVGMYYMYIYTGFYLLLGKTVGIHHTTPETTSSLI